MFSQQELLLQWALAYRKAGWFVVPAKEKRPIIKWGDLPPSVSLEQVEQWFYDAPDDAQIALITGKRSNCTVIDIDVHKEGCKAKDGGLCDCSPMNVDDLLAKFDLTMTSKTGSGGYHLFCQYEPRLKNSVGLVHDQLDIRSDGGIIILPPSKHDKYRTTYDWTDLSPWTPNNLKALMPVPEWIIQMNKEKDKHDWLKEMDGVGAGRRNDTAAAIAGKFIGAVGRNQLEVAWKMLWFWNKTNDPPLEDKELRTTFQSIADAELSKPNYGE